MRAGWLLVQACVLGASAAGCSIDGGGTRAERLDTAADGGRTGDAVESPFGHADAAMVPPGTGIVGSVEAGSPPPAPPPPKPCGSLADGQQEQRQRYPQALVMNASACVPETQTRTCHDGALSAWSGTAMATDCKVTLFGVCSALVGCDQGECAGSKTTPLTLQCLSSNGTSCSADEECVNACASGTCSDYASPGTSCEDDGDCDASACLGITCQNQVCACPNGALCSDNTQCQGTCANYVCVAFDTRCDESADCAANASCVLASCLLNDGETCGSNSDCANTCIAQQCAIKSGLHGPCDDNGDCAVSTQVLSCSAGAQSGQECLLPRGSLCTANEDCASASCACVSSACQLKLCS